MRKERKHWSTSFVAACLCAMALLMCLNLPERTQAADKETTPITEYAKAEETTTWKVLWIIVKKTTATKESVKYEGSEVSEEQIDGLTNIVFKNFEDYIYEYSMHYMKIESTVVVLDSIEATPLEAYGFIVGDEEIKEALKKKEIDPNDFDQVTCAWQPENYEDESKKIGTYGYWGLGGPRLSGTKAGYTQVILYSPRLQEYGIDFEKAEKEAADAGSDTEGETASVIELIKWKDEEGKLTAHYCDVYVHEFMHSLEFWVSWEYPHGASRDMPSPDGYESYYAEPATDLMEDFYKDFFRGNVPTAPNATTTFGMTIADYALNPRSTVENTVGEVSAATLDEWNNVITKIGLCGSDKNTKITLKANIDAADKEIYTLAKFAGVIDGDGYAILNAKFEKNGLVGDLLTTGVIKNLTMINAAVDEAQCNAGILVSYNYGTISNCGVTGYIFGDIQMAGVAGVNNGGLIEHCFNGAVVKGKGGFIGGIVGYNTGTVKNCYSYGVVKNRSSIALYPISSSAQNSYYLEGSCAVDEGATVCTEEEMTAQELVDALNQDLETAVWKKGTKYPQFVNAKYTLEEYPEMEVDLEIESDAIVLWANGSKDNKKMTLTTTLTATNYTDAKGKTKKGKMVWICKNEDIDIVFDTTKHTVTTKSDKNRLSVSNKGVIQAKAAGTVYVYAIDTGSMEYEKFVIEVKNAPTKLSLTTTAGATEKTAQVKTVVLQVGSTSDKIYINNFLKKEIIAMDNMKYTVTVDAKSGGAVTAESVSKDGNGYYLTVTAVKNAVAGKATNASVTVVNDQSGKKIKLTIKVVDSVKTVTVTGDTQLKAKKDVANLQLTFETNGGKSVTTDAVKVYVCASAPTVNGTKVTATASKDVGVKFTAKDNKLVLTAKQDISSELGVYLVCTEKAGKTATVMKIATIGADGSIK